MAIDPNLVTTIRVGELPLGAFGLTNKIPHEIGTDLFHGTIGELIAFIAPLISAVQFEVKTLHVNQAYIDDNFDITGLGINLMTGYAIVNGNNGTINKDGRVGIAYGAVTNVIGQFGGEKEHTLTIPEMPAHNHKLPTDGGGSVDMQSLVPSAGSDERFLNDSEVTGGGLPHNNMQPYLVELQVMKL